MARSIPPRRPFVTRPVRRPALGVQQNRVVTVMGESDYTGSTLTASVFALTANGSATTTLTGTVYRNGVLASGVPVTFTVQRITMNAADSFVSASPSDIASDGVETSTITVQALYALNGDLVGLPGIPASAVVLAAATTTGNTLVQPATATNANGVTTGTIKTTDAATSKTITATIAGLAATDTAVVTTDGGYVPPAPSDPFFTETFESGNFANANGFVWGATAGDVVVNNDAAYSGTYSAAFTYGPNAVGVDDQAQKGFALGHDCDELWIEFYLYVPVGYTHRDEGANKFIRLWKDDYGNDAKMGASLDDDGAGGSQFFFEYNRRIWSTGVVGQGLGPRVNFLSDSDEGNWIQVRMHFKPVSAENADDGVMEMWKDGTRLINFTGVDQGWESGGNVFRTGYLLGYSNSGFTDATTLRIDALKFYDSDPSW